MIKLIISGSSLQITLNGEFLLVVPKEICAIDVLTLYNSVPKITIYNKYLATGTTIFVARLDSCIDENEEPFTVESFILFSENNLGFNDDGGISDHNLLSNLQGGIPDEYFHLSQSQHERVLDLIYINLQVTFTRTSSATFERGVSYTPSFSWNIIPNDDVITGRSINNGIGALATNSGTVSSAPIFVTPSPQFILTVNFTRNGTPLSQNFNTSIQGLVPQWRGASDVEDFSTFPPLTIYGELNANLQKLVQGTPILSGIFTLDDEYLWFVSTSGSATIQDSGFTVTIGAWEDPTVAFWRKSLVLTLADGVTEATVWLYRSRLLLTRTNANYSFF
jgi:hypothetical protein